MKSFARLQPVFFLTILFYCVFVFKTIPASAAVSFSRTLSLGASGPDVVELQKILNTNPSTQVSQSGIGSPGNESSYFGTLTEAAVIRFQEKYSAQILVPNGLSVGTGIVGVSTRAVLNNMEQNPAVSASKSSVTAQNTQNQPQVQQNSPLSMVSVGSYPSPISSTTNPNNLTHVNTLLADINTVGQKQGLTTAEIQKAQNAVLQVVATSTDLMQAFLAAADLKSSPQVSETPFQQALGKFLAVTQAFLKPEQAHAQASTPFGGALIDSVYCTGSENWLLTVEPLPPTFAALLTYETGTQVYMSFDIPATLELLGSYTSGSQCIEGICPYCVTIPSEGEVSSETGSS